MTIQRAIWLEPFALPGALPWTCPYCGAAKLSVKPESMHEGETRESRAERTHDAWEPEWMSGRFACLLVCPHCQGELGLAGSYEVRDERGYCQGEEVGGYNSYYQPRYLTDAPHIISIPDKTPSSVVSQLEHSFRLYWADAFACANRLRIAVEDLLTAQRVPRSTGGPRTGKKRSMLSLHHRIGGFGAQHSALADQLMAIKWIGNAGSHADAVSQDDLLDAYEILAYVLDELYVKRGARVSKISRSINRRKAPRSPRRPNA